MTELPVEVVRRGRRAGAALALVAALTLAVNTHWIVGHLDWLRPLETGQLAPPFDLGLLGAAGKPSGERVTSDGLRGKVVVIEFWATWCGPCLAALPILDRAARGWGDRVVTIAVNLDDARRARQIFDDQGWRMALAGSDDEVAIRYQVEALPHLVVIGRDGVVRAVVRGGRAMATVEPVVARLLAAP